VHLVRPDVGTLHRLGRAGDGLRDVALVDQRARRRGIGAQGLFQIGEIGQIRDRLPAHGQLLGRPDRILLALGDDADEVADAHHGDEAGNVAHRAFVDRDEAGADERSGIDAGIGWAHHAAMQHAGDADVVHEGQLARRLGRKVDARNGLADDGVVADGLDRDALVKFEPYRLVADQFAIADAAIVRPADQSVLDSQFGRGELQPLGRTS